ncbi:MAG: 6-phosphogluconolactonase, partial [Terricaulis sp.]
APAIGSGARLLPMYAHGVRVDEAALRADASYAGKHIDIALMGMGADGHTASWFPQSPQIEDALDIDNPRIVIAVEAHNAAGAAARLTLTRSALSRASAITMLITGDEKRSLLGKADRAALPVDRLFDLRAPAEAFWSA